jgi:hypothetical protein
MIFPCTSARQPVASIHPAPRRLHRIRLGGHVWFLAPCYENMAACIRQNLDQAGGVGLLNNGNACWRVSTKVN